MARSADRRRSGSAIARGKLPRVLQLLRSRAAPAAAPAAARTWSGASTSPTSNRSSGGCAAQQRAQARRATWRSSSVSSLAHAELAQCTTSASPDRRTGSELLRDLRARGLARQHPARGRHQRIDGAAPGPTARRRRAIGCRSLTRATRPASTVRITASTAGQVGRGRWWSRSSGRTRPPPSSSRAAVGVELAGDVVQQQQRRARRAARCSRSASARISASSARRCSPCEPNARRSRSCSNSDDVVQVRARRRWRRARYRGGDGAAQGRRPATDRPPTLRQVAQRPLAGVAAQHRQPRRERRRPGARRAGRGPRSAAAPPPPAARPRDPAHPPPRRRRGPGAAGDFAAPGARPYSAERGASAGHSRASTRSR